MGAGKDQRDERGLFEDREKIGEKVRWRSSELMLQALESPG